MPVVLFAAKAAPTGLCEFIGPTAVTGAMIRIISSFCLLLFSLASQAEEPQVLKASSPPNRVVLLELYTSEGCSSCPPADRFFSSLKETVYDEQQLIPLAFHVTYWDYIGWQDRFADDIHDLRQRRQAAMNASRTVYTPQFLINGHDYRPGKYINNDVNRVNSSKAEMTIHLEVAHAAPDELQVRVSTEQVNDERRHLWLAVYENNLQSQVDDGENEGELLKHDYVVRRLLGPFSVSGMKDQVNTAVRLDDEWKRQDLGVVAFVQKTDSSEVVQAARVTLR